MPSSDYPRRLRRTQTRAEALLWHRLRDRRLNHAKFRRQHQIANRIADFCCLERRLIVELDGGHHELQQRSDRIRTEFLEAVGYRVIRFWNNEVTEDNIEAVLGQIAEVLKQPPPI